MKLLFHEKNQFRNLAVLMPLSIFKNNEKSFSDVSVLTNMRATSQMWALTFKLIKIKWN